MKLDSVATLLDFDPYSQRLTAQSQSHNLGEMVIDADQRYFRFNLSGNATQSAGKLKISPAKFTTWDNMTTAAAAIGSTQVTITLGATNNLAANALSEGYLIVSDGTGVGQTYKVKSNPAIVASASGTVTLYDPIVVALDSTSKTSLVLNAYNLSVEGTVQTTRPSGVPLIATTALAYSWLQTKGIASVLIDTAIALGNTCVTSSSVAGAVAIGSTTYGTFQATWAVGKAITAGVDTKYNAVFLSLD